MKYNPDDHPHPGKVLHSQLEEIGLSQGAFAHYLQVDEEEIVALCSEQGAMTATLAQKIARAFGTSPRQWMELQMNFDLVRVDQSEYQQIRELGADPEQEA